MEDHQREMVSVRIRDIFENLPEYRDSISKVTVRDAGTKGEGFASQTFCVRVDLKEGSKPHQKSLNLFVKTETCNESHSKFLEEAKLFKKEVTFYRRYLEDLKALCLEKGCENLLDIYPKCFYGDGMFLVFEDVSLERGFQMGDKSKFHDFETASMAMKTLAQHHALSHAMIEEVGGPIEFFKKYEDLDFEVWAKFESMLSPMTECLIQTILQILQTATVEGKEEAIQFYEAHLGNAWKVIMQGLERDERVDTVRVLNHGDYWNNNMMFTRDPDKGEVTSQVTYDLPATRYGSPTIDFGYYLYASVAPEVRRQRLEDLFSSYVSVFNETSTTLGRPTSLTSEELMQSYRMKHIDYGFWFFGTSTVTTAGNDILKDFDITKVKPSEWGSVLTQLIRKWMESNKGRCESDALAIIEHVREYLKLIEIRAK